MQSFLEQERKSFNSILKQSINSFLEAKKNNKVKCICGNASGFKINVEKNELTCKNCNMEIKLEEKATCV